MNQTNQTNQTRLAVFTLALEFSMDPHKQVQHRHVLGMLMQSGSIEVGLKPSGLTRFAYKAGDMFLSRRHVEEWIRTDDIEIFALGVSDAALAAASERSIGEVELRSTAHLDDARVGPLVAAVKAERAAGFPSGRLFLDSVEQALAAVLVAHHAVRDHPVRTYRGGLTPKRLQKVVELVHAKIDQDLSLSEMADSAALSIAHFVRMFRESTGESPHRFVLRQRIEHAKKLLLEPEARVLDVALACGFKTQQHFARVFRNECGTSPTQYRQELLH